VTDGRAGASLVSVVIPSYNGARLLGDAIDSVLAQTHPAVETIVVDDGSTDETPAVAARYAGRIHYLRQENRGVCAARNVGLAAAAGVYVDFLDHDDRFAPEKLARQVAVLDARPEVGLVYTGWRFIDADGAPFPPVAWPRREGDVLADLVVANFVFLGAVMVRRSLLTATGGFDERLRGAEDWEMWLRLTRQGARWACVDAPLFDYRLHDEQRHRRGAERRATNRMAVLRDVFADPALPPDVRAREREAYRHAHLRAAIDYHRAGDRLRAAEEFHAAVLACPDLVADPKALLEVCRLLAPAGRPHQAAMVEAWRPLTRALRVLVGDLLRRPGLEPEIRRRAWAARLAVVRVTARLGRKRLKAILAG
jgi:glycosyltransferase involved in cell wall biosynthesis